MERPRLLLLMTATTYRASAFLQAAARLGVPVTVGSDRRQVLESENPLGHLTLDFDDPASGSRAIAAFAARQPIRAILAADDDGVILAAIACEALGLAHNSVEAVRATRDKHRTRQLLRSAGLNAPAFIRVSTSEDPVQVVNEVEAQVGFPCVIKPLALSASRGVIRINDPFEFAGAFERVGRIERPAPEVLIEGYIPGAEVALEGLLTRGELRVLSLFDKPDPLEGPFFEETIYVTPSRLPAAVQKDIAGATASAVASLGLREGPIHAELRLNERGPWVLEIAPRSIGGLCSRTLRFVPSASLEELILRHALGREVDSYERDSRAAGVMMIPIPKGGVLREVRGRAEALAVKNIEDVTVTIPIGQEVVPLPEGSRYLGFIFARSETPEQVEGALREAHARLDFVITPREVAEQTSGDPNQPALVRSRGPGCA
jgi:biotin carboxylase